MLKTRVITALLLLAVLLPVLFFRLISGVCRDRRDFFAAAAWECFSPVQQQATGHWRGDLDRGLRFHLVP
ncbi:hypothetical protein ACFS07_18405 [Undibacterium arcticum]